MIANQGRFRHIIPLVNSLLLFLLILSVNSCGIFYRSEDSPFSNKVPQGVPVEKTAESQDDANENDLRPFLRENGEKHIISVLDSDGLWTPYVEVFIGMIEGLQTIGWIKEDIELPESENTTIKEYIDRLNEMDYSDYLVIDPDLYIDLEWDESQADTPLFQEIFSDESPADLVICLGTLGAQIISRYPRIPVPVIADSISDPIESGIILSNTDSGKDNLTVRVDPERYIRQIRLFYDTVQFKKLGMIYEDTQDGRAYAALDDVETISREKGFEIISNTNVLGDSAPSEEEAEKYFVEAVRALAPEIDAIYLTEQKGLSSNNITEVMEILKKNKVPSFSMTGAEMVKKGVLFGVTDSERISTGIYQAKNIVSIFRGKKPREINQVFEHIPHIAVNLDAARDIGYDVPIDIITSSDEIYQARKEQ